MRIDPKSEIAGYPAIKIRDLVRGLMHGYFCAQNVQHRLHVNHAEAIRVIDELAVLGFVERPKIFVDDDKLWITTTFGNGLGCASAAKPVHRKTAEKKLAEFLDRAREINDDEEMAMLVIRVAVFGSYLTDVERLGDVDVAVSYGKRHEDQEKQERAEEARREKAWKAGRSLSFLGQMFWPSTEVELRLKGRSRTISMHPMHDLISLSVEHRIVFDIAGGF